jgi:formylglycine-generating enzyme required for sulfatase activity
MKPPRQSKDVDPLNPEMAQIPGGSYVVGWDGRKDWLETAYPKDTRYLAPPEYLVNRLPTTRTVTLAPFLIGKYEVTRLEYRQYAKETDAKVPKVWGTKRDFADWGRYPQDNPAPADWLTWVEAADYCKWLSKRTGREYRLPTADEWEVAAQGPQRCTFPWGNEFPPFGTEKGKKLRLERPNTYGVYHMGWLLAEWCSDECPAPDKRLKVIRGGRCSSDSATTIVSFCSHKQCMPPDKGWYASGFRLAADVPREK